MKKSYVNLSTTESAIIQAAAQIYAAHITAGHVLEGEENTWLKRSLRDAVVLTNATDDVVVSDQEVDSSESQSMSTISVGRVRGKSSRME